MPDMRPRGTYTPPTVEEMLSGSKTALAASESSLPKTREQMVEEQTAQHMYEFSSELRKDPFFATLGRGRQEGEGFFDYSWRASKQVGKFLYKTEMEREKFIAQELTAGEEVLRQMKRTGNVLGTPVYLTAAMLQDLPRAAVSAVALTGQELLDYWRGQAPHPMRRPEEMRDRGPDIGDSKWKTVPWAILLGADPVKDELGNITGWAPRKIQSWFSRVQTVEDWLWGEQKKEGKLGKDIMYKEIAVAGAAGMMVLEVSTFGILKQIQTAIAKRALITATKTSIAAKLAILAEREGVTLSEKALAGATSAIRLGLESGNAVKAQKLLEEWAVKHLPENSELRRGLGIIASKRAADVANSSGILRDIAKTYKSPSLFREGVTEMMQGKRASVIVGLTKYITDLSKSKLVAGWISRQRVIYKEFGDDAAGELALRADTPAAVKAEFDQVTTNLLRFQEKVVNPYLGYIASAGKEVPLGQSIFDITKQIQDETGKSMKQVLNQIYRDSRKAAETETKIADGVAPISDGANESLMSLLKDYQATLTRLKTEGKLGASKMNEARIMNMLIDSERVARGLPNPTEGLMKVIPQDIQMLDKNSYLKRAMGARSIVSKEQFMSRAAPGSTIKIATKDALEAKSESAFIRDSEEVVYATPKKGVFVHDSKLAQKMAKDAGEDVASTVPFVAGISKPIDLSSHTIIGPVIAGLLKKFGGGAVAAGSDLHAQIEQLLGAMSKYGYDGVMYNVDGVPARMVLDSGQQVMGARDFYKLAHDVSKNLKEGLGPVMWRQWIKSHLAHSADIAGSKAAAAAKKSNHKVAKILEDGIPWRGGAIESSGMSRQSYDSLLSQTADILVTQEFRIKALFALRPSAKLMDEALQAIVITQRGKNGSSLLFHWEVAVDAEGKRVINLVRTNENGGRELISGFRDSFFERKGKQLKEAFVKESDKRMAEIDKNLPKGYLKAEDYKKQSVGHKTFFEMLDGLRTSGVLTPDYVYELADLFKYSSSDEMAEMAKNTTARWWGRTGLSPKLGGISANELAEARRGSIGGMTGHKIYLTPPSLHSVTKGQIAMTGGLYNSALSSTSTFLHEYAHWGYKRFLNDFDRDRVFEAWKRAVRNYEPSDDLGFPTSASSQGYAHMTHEEFFSEAFANYVLTQRVVDNDLVSIFSKLTKRLGSSISRTLGVKGALSSSNDLTDLFEQLLRMEKSKNFKERLSGGPNLGDVFVRPDGSTFTGPGFGMKIQPSLWGILADARGGIVSRTDAAVAFNLSYPDKEYIKLLTKINELSHVSIYNNEAKMFEAMNPAQSKFYSGYLKFEDEMNFLRTDNGEDLTKKLTKAQIEKLKKKYGVPADSSPLSAKDERLLASAIKTIDTFAAIENRNEYQMGVLARARERYAELRLKKDTSVVRGQKEAYALDEAAQLVAAGESARLAGLVKAHSQFIAQERNILRGTNVIGTAENDAYKMIITKLEGGQKGLGKAVYMLDKETGELIRAGHVAPSSEYHKSFPVKRAMWDQFPEQVKMDMVAKHQMEEMLGHEKKVFNEALAEHNLSKYATRIVKEKEALEGKKWKKDNPKERPMIPPTPIEVKYGQPQLPEEFFDAEHRRLGAISLGIFQGREYTKFGDDAASKELAKLKRALTGLAKTPEGSRTKWHKQELASATADYEAKKAQHAATKMQAKDIFQASFAKDALHVDVKSSEKMGAVADSIDKMFDGIRVPSVLRKGNAQLASFVRRVSKVVAKGEERRAKEIAALRQSKKDIMVKMRDKARDIKLRKQDLMDYVSKKTNERTVAKAHILKIFEEGGDLVSYALRPTVDLSKSQVKSLVTMIKNVETEAQLVKTMAAVNKMIDKNARENAADLIQTVLDKYKEGVPIHYQDRINALLGPGIRFNVPETKAELRLEEKLKALKAYLLVEPAAEYRMTSRKTLSQLEKLPELDKTPVTKFKTDELVVLADRVNRLFQEGKVAKDVWEGKEVTGVRVKRIVMELKDGTFVTKNVELASKTSVTHKIEGIRTLRAEAVAREVAENSRPINTSTRLPNYLNGGIDSSSFYERWLKQLQDNLDPRNMFREGIVHGLSSQRLFMMLDNFNPRGRLYWLFRHPVVHGAEMADEESTQSITRFGKHMSDMMKKYKLASGKYYDETDLANTMWRRIAIYAYTRQRGTMQRLAAAGITEKEIATIADDIGQPLGHKLQPWELETYNFMRAELDKIWPKLNETMRTYHNEELGWIDNYFMVDNRLHNQYQIRVPGKENLEVTGPITVRERIRNEFDHQKRRVTSNFAKERFKMTKERDMLLNAKEIYIKYLKDTSYFIHVEPRLQAVGDVMNAAGFKEAVGDVGHAGLADWIDLMARRGIPQNYEYGIIDVLAKRLGSSTLGANLSPIIKQPLAILVSIGVLGPVAHMDALYIMGVNGARNTFAGIRKNSMSMLARSFDDESFALAVKRDDIDKYIEHGYKGIKIVDGATASLAWLAAFRTRLKELGKTINLDEFNAGYKRLADGEFEDLAIRDAANFADDHVVKTQGSGKFQDLPLMLSGKNKKVWKTVLMYQNFVYNQSQALMFDAFYSAAHQIARSQGNNAQIMSILGHSAGVTGGVVAGVMLEDRLSQMMAGWWGSKSYEDSLKERTPGEYAADILTSLVPFPIGTIAALANADNNRTQVPIIDSPISLIRAAGGVLSKEDPKARAKDATRVVQEILALTKGYPGLGFLGTIVRGRWGIDGIYETPAEAAADALRRGDVVDLKATLNTAYSEGLDVTKIVESALSSVNAKERKDRSAQVDQAYTLLISAPAELQNQVLNQIVAGDGWEEDYTKDLLSKLKKEAAKAARGESTTFPAPQERPDQKLFYRTIYEGENVVLTPNDVPKLKARTMNAYAWTPEARAQLAELDVRAITERPKDEALTWVAAGIQGGYEPAESEKTLFSGEKITPGFTTLVTQVTSTLAHEFLHDAFDRGPLSQNPARNKSDPKVSEAFVDRFNATWDKLAKQGDDHLQWIDGVKLDSGDPIYEGIDKYHRAAERFAYLGESVGDRDVGYLKAIPKELRPYYKQVFDFSKIGSEPKNLYEGRGK